MTVSGHRKKYICGLAREYVAGSFYPGSGVAGVERMSTLPPPVISHGQHDTPDLNRAFNLAMGIDARPSGEVLWATDLSPPPVFNGSVEITPPVKIFVPPFARDLRFCGRCGALTEWAIEYCLRPLGETS